MKRNSIKEVPKVTNKNVLFENISDTKAYLT